MNKILFTLSATLAIGPLFSADTPWLTQAGHFDTNLTLATQSYDEFWLGETKLNTKDAFGGEGKVSQSVATLSASYGITEWLAADVALGYTKIDFKPLDTTDKGLNDSTFGFQALILDENKPLFSFAPSLSVRLGGIIKGTYDTDIGTPTSAGLGSNGYDLSLALGRYFIDTGTGVFANGGFRDYSGEVPTSRYWAVGAFQEILKQASVHAIYRKAASTSGVDIGGPGFTGDFRQVKEERTALELGLTYIGFSQANLGIFVAKVLDGRNVGQDTVVGLNAGYSF